MNNFFIGSDGKYYRKGTLAHYLDTRTISIGEPDSTNLPAKLNPLQFLLENVFKDRLGFIIIDKKCCQDFIDTPALSNILSTCTVAGNLNIIYMKLDALKDTIQSGLHVDASTVVPVIEKIDDNYISSSIDNFSITEMRG